MKIKYFLFIGLLVATMAPFALLAQTAHPLAFGTSSSGAAVANWYNDYVGTVFQITSPSSIAGTKSFTTSNDGSGSSGAWGGFASTLSGTLKYGPSSDSDGCAAFTSGYFSGKIAVIWRGTCEFGFKALQAQNAGATAVVLINYIPGGPVPMGAGAYGSSVTIPVYMVSMADGMDIAYQLNTGTTVTLNVHNWASGYSNDLGFVPQGVSTSAYGAIPFSQLSASSHPQAYQNKNGAFVANYGSHTATHVKLTSKLNFTPTGSSTASQIYADSVSLSGSFPQTDSIWALYGSAYNIPSVSGTGKFDLNYKISSDSTDGFTGDNALTYSFYATDSVFSKGRYDLVNNKPVTTTYLGPASSTNYIWGVPYYIANSGYAIRNVQFSVTSSSAGFLLPGGDQVAIRVYKWVDAATGPYHDSLMQNSELQLVGTGFKIFDGSTDSVRETFTVPIGDYTGAPATVYLDASSWYVIAAELPSGYFLGCDGGISGLPRTYGREHFDNYFDAYNPVYIGSRTDQIANPTAAFNPISFGSIASKAVDSVVYSSQKGLIPALPFTVFAATPPVTGTWRPLTNTAPHSNAGVMLLLTDGTVLAKTTAGGSDGIGNTWDKLTPDSHGSYLNGTWSTIAPMRDTRLYFSSQVMPDGRVYVAGGEYGTGKPFGEMYNPLTNIWTPNGTLPAGDTILDANSELLPDGRILQAVVVSSGYRENYIYNPSTNAYTAGPSSYGSHDEAAWVKLPDNSILYVDIGSTSTERYIPSTNTWIHDSAAPVMLYDPYGYEAGAGFLLPDGRVFFLGSSGHTAYYTPTGTTSPGSWAAGPDIPSGRGTPDAAAAMMVNGKILCAVSPIPTAANHFPSPTAFYEFDYTTNTFTLTGAPGGGDSLSQSCYITNMLDLPDGTVLFANQQSNQYFQYVPTGSPLASGKPTISTIGSTSCDNYSITGTLFNGISEGAAYGDDWQMSSNYPIVRITSGSNIFYARTSNWNRLGAVRTGSLPDTAQFSLPPGIAAGTYTLEVIANGIASDPTTFSTAGTIAPITGTTSISTGGTSILSDATAGGTWSTSDASIATVDSAGVVTGVSSGSAVISYTAMLSCGSSTATTFVHISGASGGYCTPVYSFASDACSLYGVNISNFIIPGESSILHDSSSCSGSGYEDLTSLSVILFLGGSYTTSIAAYGSNPMDAQVWIDFNNNGTFESSEGVGGINNYTLTGSFTIAIPSGAAVGSHRMRLVTSYDGSGHYYPSMDPCTSGYDYGDARDYMVSVSAPTYCTPGTANGCTYQDQYRSFTTTGGTANINHTPGAACVWGTGGFTYFTGSGLNCQASQGSTVNFAIANNVGYPEYYAMWVDWNQNLVFDSGEQVYGTSHLDSNMTGTGSIVVPATATLGTTRLRLRCAYYDSAIGPCDYLATDYGIISDFDFTVTCPVPVVGAISGGSTVCSGASITLTDSTTGGTWHSSDSTRATVSTSGIVTGVSTGSVTIAYTVTTSCGSTTVTKSITVSAAPSAGTISGASTICAGTSTTYSDGVSGGTWSSSATSVASVASSGVVTGITAGSAVISYTVTNSCGTAVATRSITVSSTTTPDTISGSPAVCIGSTTTYTDAVSGGTWSSGFSSIATISSSGVITGVSTGTSTITYTMTSSCGTTRVTKSISVITVPTVGPVSGATSVCSGATTTYTVGVTGGTWSSGSTSIATVSSGGVVTGVSAGSAIISYSLTNSCGTTTSTKTISVSSGASAGSITGASAICAGSTTTLSDAVSGGTWSSGDASVATISSSGIVTGVSAGSAIISYTVSSSCGSAVATRTITVNPAPAAGTIYGTTTACVGSAITLTDSTTGGTWSSSTSVATVSSSGIVTGVSAGATTISYSVTTSCGSATATFAVTVIPTPVVGTITGASSVCIGANTTLADTPAGGSWSSSNTALATVSSTGVVRGVSGGTVTISYTIANACGSAVATKSIAVNTYAGAISGATNICTSSTTTLTTTVSGGTWSSLATSVATVSAASGVVTGVAAGGVTIRYTVTGTCGAGHTDFNMVVSAPGAITASSGASTLCMGASATFTNSTAPGGGSWSSSNAAIATVSASGGVVTGVSGGTAAITYTLTNACGTVSTSRNITITGTPVPAAISGSSSAICVGSTLALTDGTAGGTWTSANTSVATISGSGLVTAVAAGIDTIRYSVTNSCGFTGSVFRVVTVNVSAPVTLSGISSICVGSTATLTTAGTGGTWSSLYTSIATITSGGVVTGVNAGIDTFKYTVVNGCGTFVSRFPLLVASPTVAAIAGSSTVCPGASTTFTDATIGGSWGSTDDAIATVSSAGLVNGLVSGNDTIIYTITNACGTMSVMKAITVTGPTYPYAITGSISTVCTGATAPYGNATSGGVWSLSSTSLATIDASGTVTGIAGGIDTIKYTIINSCGIPGAALRAITILAPPSAGTISGPSNICTTGGTISYTSSGDAGGSWSSTNPSAATVGVTGIVTPVSGSATTIKYTVSNSCGTSVASQYVTVSAPGITTSTGPTTLCLGSSATFANATAGGTWSSSASGIATVSTTGLVTSVSGGTATISYTITNACGTTSTARNVAINTSVPTGITISGPSTVAIGATITLTHAGATGAWSSVTPTLATITSGGVVTGVAVGTDTIRYTVTNGCGTTIATKTVAVTAHRGFAGSAAGQETPAVKLYPNPTSGIVKLEFTGNNGTSTIVVTDVSGKVLFSKTTEDASLELDLGNVASGVYLISINMGGTQFNEKVIVE